MVFDPRAENPPVIIGADFFPAVVSDFLPKKSGYIIRFYSKNCGSDSLIIKRSWVIRPFEHDVSCTLNLLDSPCIAEAKALSHGAIPFCKNIQDFVEVFRIDPARKLLCHFHIGNFKKSIVMHTVFNMFLLQFINEEIMPVHVKLQTERSPCGDTHAYFAYF